MGRFGMFSIVTISLAVSLAGQQSGQQPTVFRGTTENVPVFVTVTDKSGRLVPDLTRDDFEVLDNGKVRPITVFDNSPQPVRLIVMIDVSGSMAGDPTLLREASHELFITLREAAQLRVGTFGDQINISPEFTHNVAKLEASLPMDIPMSARTPLWKGVETAMDELAHADGRRVVAVLSDGKDTAPMSGRQFLTPLDITERALREDVMIYGIGFQSRGRGFPGGNLGQAIVDSFPDPSLGTVALDRGGGYLGGRSHANLQTAL